MAEKTSERIRVIFRGLQILDALDADGEGEFKFTCRVSGTNSTGEFLQETKLPRKKKFYRISDNMAWNRLTLDELLYEGEVVDNLKIEILGEEIDLFKPNDHLDPYRREFTGSPSSWIGSYLPGDEGSSDPERMSNWWVFVDIQQA